MEDGFVPASAPTLKSER
ncbi:hypothetical protein L195_g039334, partial [Trifolium pratense]